MKDVKVKLLKNHTHCGVQHAPGPNQPLRLRAAHPDLLLDQDV